jgi:serine/threonine-protein kinase RsbW
VKGERPGNGGDAGEPQAGRSGRTVGRIGRGEVPGREAAPAVTDQGPGNTSQWRAAQAMTNSSWIWSIDREIPSCSLHGHRLILEIVEQLQAAEWNPKDIFGVHLALEEAVVNAIKHGNCEDPAKTVHVTCKISESCCWIQVSDQGSGFDPEQVPDCTLDENLDKPSGRGLKLMRNFMTMVEYNEHGNRVVMEKRLDAS